MSPRQPITSAPHAIKSLTAESAGSANTANTATTANTANTATNATQLGGVAANQFVQTTDPRLSDARNPLAGSTNYIQNTTTAQSANFNITGNGNALGNLSAGGSVNTTNGYLSGGQPFLRASNGTASTFLGLGAGTSNSGNQNTFVGANAGNDNTSGFNNSYFGTSAGESGVGVSNNSFFGRLAGFSNTASNNSFFGAAAGQANISGAGNAFFGAGSGGANTGSGGNSYFGFNAGLVAQGSNHSYFGSTAGVNTVGGGENVFIGANSGSAITNGSRITLIGAETDTLGTTTLLNATAIGWRARVDQNDSLVLGSIFGVNGANASARIGIGTTAPVAPLHVSSAGESLLIHRPCNGGMAITFGTSADCNDFNILRFGDSITINRPTGGAIIFSEGNTSVQVRIEPGGFLRVPTVGAAGATALCRNASLQISTCSSSLRYKNNIATFSSGMSLVHRLRPISFDWKDGGMKDVGFGAEDVAAVDPRLVTYNAKGEIEGVKYDRLSVVLVNAIKEQDAVIKNSAKQISNLLNELSAQKAMITALQKMVCMRRNRSAACKGGLK